MALEYASNPTAHCNDEDDVEGDVDDDEYDDNVENHGSIPKDVLDGGVRSAIIHCLGSPYFPQPKKNIQVVSRGIGIGYLEMLDLRYWWGEQKTNMVLIVHGLLGNGLQKTSPLERSWECPSAPAVGNKNGSTCNCEPGSRSSRVVMVGRFLREHPLYGLFMCQQCYRKVETRERKALQQKKESADLTTTQEQRLALLHKRARNKSAQNSVNVTNLITNTTIENKNVRIRNRNYQSRRPKRIHKSNNHSSTTSNEPKKNPPKRAKDTKKTKSQMIDSIQNKMTHAARIWIRLYGQEWLYWNDIIFLFDLVLIREAKTAGLTLEYNTDQK